MREIDEDFLDACRREGDPDGEALVQLVFEALETGGSHADATPPARRLSVTTTW